MRVPRLFLPAFLLFSAVGCGTVRNFELECSEAVSGPEEDFPAYLQIHIDGFPAGRTEALPKSQEKKWARRLPAGNHLFRFEYWTQPPGADWAPLDSSRQPHERFIRVEREGKVKAVLKFYDGGRKHSLDITRQP